MKYTEVTPEEIAAARRAYQNAWRAKNKDKVRRYNINYWTKKAAELKKGEQNERN